MMKAKKSLVAIVTCESEYYDDAPNTLKANFTADDAQNYHAGVKSVRSLGLHAAEFLFCGSIDWALDFEDGEDPYPVRMATAVMRITKFGVSLHADPLHCSSDLRCTTSAVPHANIGQYLPLG